MGKLHLVKKNSPYRRTLCGRELCDQDRFYKFHEFIEQQERCAACTHKYLKHTERLPVVAKAA